MKPIKQQYLILSAQSYRIVDENTGAVNEGISLWYIPDDNLDPAEDLIAGERGDIVRGMKVAKMSLPLTLASKMSHFPALYDVTLEMITAQQKQQVRARDVDFVSAVKLVPEKATATGTNKTSA